MSRSLVLAAVIGLAAAPAATAGPAAPVMPHLPDIQTAQLDNGLRIAFLRDDAAPVVAVQVWYHAGSKDEPRDRRGSAHMFEHIMFKGTLHVPAEAHAQYINGLGGIANATTDEDATHYIDTLPSDYLDFAIQLEAERMRNLLFRPEMIATEKEVVKEEIRQQLNSPVARGFLEFLSVAYTKHPYAWTAGGTIADLDQTTPADLKKFYDAYYQPNNAMLVVVGKTTFDQVKASAQKWFGAIPKAPEPPRPAASEQEPAQTSQRRQVADPSQIGLTLIGWHIPAARDNDVYALQVASIVLGAGDSSRLKLRLKSVDPKTKRPLALDGGVEAIVREDPGLIVALGVYLDKSDEQPVENAIFDEVEKLGERGPTAEELRKAKNQVQAAFVFSLEHAQGLAEAIGRSWILTGDPARWEHDVDELGKVSAADVRRVVKQYMAKDHATIVVIPPSGGDAAPAPIPAAAAKGGK